MAIKAGPTSKGLAVASGIRGGSGSLAGKGVIFARIGPEGSVSVPISSTRNPKAESFLNFLISFKGGDIKTPSPSIQYEPLRAKHLNELGKQLDGLNQESNVQESLPAVNAEKQNSSQGTINFSSIQETPPKVAIPRPNEEAPVAKSGGVVEVKVNAARSEPIRVSVIRAATRTSSLIGFAPDADSRATNLIQNLLQNRARQRNRLVGKTVGVNPEPTLAQDTEGVVSIPGLSRQSTEAGVGTPNKTLVAEKAQPAKTVSMFEKPTVRKVRKTGSETYQKKRYATQDWEMDQRRLKLLTDKYEAARSENPDVEVDGAEVARRSLVGSLRSVRSIFLDQRGYYDKADGTQRKIELMLESARAINRSRLKEIINGSSALKEDDNPNHAASQKQVDEVVNRPDDIKRDYEPVEVITETIMQAKEVALSVVEDLPKNSFVKGSDLEELVPVVEATQGRGMNFRELTSSLFDMVGDNIKPVFDVVVPIVDRKELDFN